MEAGEKQLEAVFIEIEVDDSIADDAELAKKLEEVCPVDIFKAGANGVEIVDENLDECVLCELCMNATPPGSIKVIKLYDNNAVLGA
jgi:NAD-dependent dihydropyrimidine dehydrogenase PreA subunit